MVDFVQSNALALISEAVGASTITVLKADKGMAPQATIATALANCGSDVEFVDGDWQRGGYLAGLQNVIDAALEWTTKECPDLIERHQQSLKRLFPLLSSAAFTFPKDLTNTSSKEERTRFYHHEYQNKLLVGLAEYLLEYAGRSGLRVVLVIDRASEMSPTTLNLIKVLRRFDSERHFRFVLVDYSNAVFLEEAREVNFGCYSIDELVNLFSPSMARQKRRSIFEAARGNPLLVRALITCSEGGIPVVGYLSSNAAIDLHLASLTPEERSEMLRSYVEADCSPTDLIAQRNYETFSHEYADVLHAKKHQAAFERYLAGKAPLVTFHGLSVRDKFKRLELIAEPSEILKSIGLYDTWFSYFGEMFADPELRVYGTGNDAVNAVFINAAFVLYSLGCGLVSVPYLDLFYAKFPSSRYTPTVLYAQSMTYARYQQPVNLPLAEEYALRNLDTIESNFKDYDKYHYIKVFAENAYAYIKAKQGKFDEALTLCSEGKARMLEIYGDNRFKLHQSILIYNTSQVYELVNDLSLAEQKLGEAIACDPYYGEYQNDLGNLLGKVPGREVDSSNAYARAIELCPPYYEAHLNRAGLRKRLGDNQGALSDLDRALSIKPEEWRALLEKGNILLSIGNPSAAIESYLAAAEFVPSHADLQSNLGLAYSELEKPEQSIAHYQKALEINPRHAPAHNNLAIELFNANQPDAALEHANQAVDFAGDPDYEATRNHIRMSLARRARPQP
ncbi:tetratricopeptide repeat protein (plasmid) [Rhizobium sp. CC1099]|uniref:tetratricopeptide repeat protein n=1 Tax=Rhizobium sp. CC1099 TaxID=3039160 RepID=UPI0024B24BB5|nr:tetratricopeptide repeat protein [Rhizobium sp. CC1099]WFU91992.1 tetratricopeptide repeat protein [Rhizobium sp. CC1099]